MKISKSTIQVLLISLVMISGGSLFARQQNFSPDEKKLVKVKVHAPLLKLIAESLELKDADFIILSNQLEEAKAISITYAENELDLILDDEALSLLGMEEDVSSRKLEDWMFEDLIIAEEEPTIEDWMFEDDYLSDEYENTLIQDWMMEELVPEEEVQLEEWMFKALKN